MPVPIEDTPAAPVRERAGAAECAVVDGALVRAAKRGCVESFERLVRRYEKRIVCFVQKRAGRAVDAEDVAQETFIRVWGALDRFEEGRAFKPWVFTIASREAINSARKAQRRGKLIEKVRERESAQDGVETDYGGAIEEAGAVWRVAEGCLNDDDLSAMWLRYAEDMSHADIAAVQGCSAVRVRVALSRARKRVREQWERVQQSGAAGRSIGEARS